MDKFIIEGGHRLQGTVTVSGSKNAALPILAATLLTDKPCVLRGIPDLRDVRTMISLLDALGAHIKRLKNGDIQTRVTDRSECTAPYELVSTMRASICVLGPLLARRGFARVSYPGGCVIGVRPIDLHIKGLKELGAEVEIEHGDVVARSDRLRGAELYLGGAQGSTVTGTANILMAATLARGRTVIENAACEPEVTDLAEFLVAMGAKLRGVGTHRLEVEGVEALHGARHAIIPDRIEAGTFMAAAAITGGDVTIRHCREDHLGAVFDKFRETGVEVTRRNGDVRVVGARRFRPTDVTTLPFPGFPTDIQAQFLVLMTLADGISVITERIYQDRFMHVAELNRMGAEIRKDGSTAVVRGVDHLSGARVMASDLRASAALVLAGLVAKGTTEVSRIYHIDRGYDRIEKKLNALGARIRRVEDMKIIKIPAEEGA